MHYISLTLVVLHFDLINKWNIPCYIWKQGTDPFTSNKKPIEVGMTVVLQSIMGMCIETEEWSLGKAVIKQ